MEVALTILGYVIALVVVFVVTMCQTESKVAEGLVTSLSALVILGIVNGVVFIATVGGSGTPDIIAEQVAAKLYNLEEKKQYPLALATPDQKISEDIAFVLDPGRPLTRDGALLVRLSLDGKSYELELPLNSKQTPSEEPELLPVTLKQTPSGNPTVELEFDTRKGNGSVVGIYGPQTLVNETPCTVRLTGVFWCEKEQTYKPVFSQELRSLRVIDFLKESLTHVTLTVPADLYRTIKLG